MTPDDELRPSSRANRFADRRAIYNSVHGRDVETYDIMALNGLHTDIPKFKDHDAVIALARHFAPVHRKRKSRFTTEVVKDRNGEDVWIVGELGEMPRSAMLDLAKGYRNQPTRWGL